MIMMCLRKQYDNGVNEKNEWKFHNRYCYVGNVRHMSVHPVIYEYWHASTIIVKLNTVNVITNLANPKTPLLSPHAVG